MKYKLLFILIEGLDDERFFNRIISPKLEEKYTTVKLYKYAQVKEKKIRNFLKGVKAMSAEYIYVTDINFAPCISSKKQKVQGKLSNIDRDKIMLIIKEIESWYLAGLDAKSSKKLRIKSIRDTNNLIKEQFDNLMPEQFESRIDFMQETLKHFQIPVAMQKNKSFKYFFNKYDCNVR